MANHLSGERTPDLILSTALRLFNHFGVDRVAIYRIAADIGVSPGKVTHYFPRKLDILYRLTDNLEAEALEVLSATRNPDVVEMAEFLIRLFRLMWRYHFFFQSLRYLTATDPKIAKSHQRIRKVAQSASMQPIEDAVESRDIPAIEPPSSPKVLSDNMWAVWINRLGSWTPGSGRHADENLVVYDCCVHHLSFIQAYASRGYISRLHTTVKEMLGIQEKQPCKMTRSPSSHSIASGAPSPISDHRVAGRRSIGAQRDLPGHGREA
jgi:AcrR family transcriptional regulator